jgi:hypothetical protein
MNVLVLEKRKFNGQDPRKSRSQISMRFISIVTIEVQLQLKTTRQGRNCN